MPCTWQLPWLALAWPFLSFLTQTGVDKAPLPPRGSISGTVGGFQSGEAFTCRRALTIVSSLRVGVAEVLNPERLDGRRLS